MASIKYKLFHQGIGQGSVTLQVALDDLLRPIRPKADGDCVTLSGKERVQLCLLGRHGATLRALHLNPKAVVRHTRHGEKEIGHTGHEAFSGQLSEAGKASVALPTTQWRTSLGADEKEVRRHAQGTVLKAEPSYQSALLLGLGGGGVGLRHELKEEDDHAGPVPKAYDRHADYV